MTSFRITPGSMILLLLALASVAVQAQEMQFDGEAPEELSQDFDQQQFAMFGQGQGGHHGGGQGDVGNAEQEHGFMVGSRHNAQGSGQHQGHHKRIVRQISYPSTDLFNPQQQQAQPFAPPPPPQQEQNGVMKFFNDLGPQVERAKMISSLFGTTNNNSAGNQPASGGFNPATLMSQLTELIRSTQDRNARTLESTQRSLDQSGQQAMSAARQAQGGIQAALAEIGAGLQKMAANNPNLLPDIKNLYQSVSSRLSSASNSVSQAVAPKNGPEQFAEQLVKAGQQ